MTRRRTEGARAFGLCPGDEPQLVYKLPARILQVRHHQRPSPPIRVIDEAHGGSHGAGQGHRSRRWSGQQCQNLLLRREPRGDRGELPAQRDAEPRQDQEHQRRSRGETQGPPSPYLDHVLTHLDSREHCLAQPRRRGDLSHRVAELPHHPLQRCQLALALCARLHMRGHRLLLIPVQRVERERGQQFGSLLVRHWRSSSPPAS